MANGVGVPAPAARNATREVLPPAFTPVDEKRFDSEIRRLDTTVADERKNREKFETRIEKAVNDLRGEMNARFEKMEKSVDARFDKMDARFDKMEKSMGALNDKLEKSVDVLNDKMDRLFRWMMGFLVGAILIPIALQYFAR